MENRTIPCSLYELSDLMYCFCMKYYDSAKQSHNYGLEENYTMIEIHTVTSICDEPGVTVTKLAADARRTKGAISQIVKKLEKKDLIYRLPSREQANAVHLYVTEKGQRLSQLHKTFDEKGAQAYLDFLYQYFTREQVESFFAIMKKSMDVSGVY